VAKDAAEAEKARKQAEARLAAASESHAAAEAKLQAAHGDSSADAAQLRASLRQREEQLGEARAQLAHLTAQLASLSAEAADRKTREQELQERRVRLETELATLADTHRATAAQLADAQAVNAASIAALKAKIDEQTVCIHGLEATNMQQAAALASSAAAASVPRSPGNQSRSPMPGSPLSPLSRNASASTLSVHTQMLLSPSNKNLLSPNNAGGAGSASDPTAKQVVRDEAARRALEVEAKVLREAQALVRGEQEDSRREKAVLAQQRADLLQEQQLLQTAAQMLHHQLLGKLGPLLPLTPAAVNQLATERLPGLTFGAVEHARNELRDQASLTQAVATNVSNEMRSPSTKVHALSLAERLEALRRACEFHEQRLMGLSPSTSTGLVAASNSAASSPASAKLTLSPFKAGSLQMDTSSPAAAAAGAASLSSPKRVLFNGAQSPVGKQRG
jgi:chromosome segregation ATPase